MFNLPIQYAKKHEAYYSRFAPYRWSFDNFVFEYALRTSDNMPESFFRRYEYLMKVYNNILYIDIIGNLNAIMNVNVFCIEYAINLLERCSNPFSLCRRSSNSYKKIFSSKSTPEGLTEDSEELEHKEWKFLALYAEIMGEVIRQKDPYSVVDYNKYSFNRIRSIIPTETVENVVQKYIQILSYRNIVVRRHNNISYFFDEKGIYCSEENYNSESIQCDLFFCKWGISNTVKCNYLIARVALTQMKIGMNVDDFVEIYKNTKLKNKSKLTGIDKAIYIDKPIFLRYPENPNEKTFDMIEVEVRICIEKLEENIKVFEHKHRNDIAKRIGEKLMRSQEFKRYNIPLQFIKITSIQCSMLSNSIRYILEIKLN